jgi:hypothetical protein
MRWLKEEGNWIAAAFSGGSFGGMATSKETIHFMLAKLRHDDRFGVRAMFGEYALYVDGKTVALICDDRLYVKMTPASGELERLCEQGPPYPGAQSHYIVDEGQLSTLERLPSILFAVAASLPVKRKRSAPKG